MALTRAEISCQTPLFPQSHLNPLRIVPCIHKVLADRSGHFIILRCIPFSKYRLLFFLVKPPSPPTTLPQIERLTWSPIEMTTHIIPSLDLTAWLLTGGGLQPQLFSFLFSPTPHPHHCSRPHTREPFWHVMYLSTVRLMSLFSYCRGSPWVFAHIQRERLVRSL